MSCLHRSDVELQQIKAAVTLQSAWRGFKGRQLVKTIRLVFNNAAIVIQVWIMLGDSPTTHTHTHTHTYTQSLTHTQAHYKGYRLRSRLRKLLENVRYTDGKEQISDSVGGVGDQGDDVMGGANVEVNFEEEIIVDYLDEVSNDYIHQIQVSLILYSIIHPVPVGRMLTKYKYL